MPRTRSLLWAELKLGIIGVVALGLTVVLILAVGGQGGFFWQRYPLKARFETVQGLKTGAVVRLNGKEIGKVTSVEFAGPEIEVVMTVSKNTRALVTTESRAVVGSLSLLGEPIIDVTASRVGTPLGDWAYVTAGGTGGMLGSLASTASKGLTSANDLIADVRAGRGTAGKFVTDDAVYAELRRFLSSASRVTESIEKGKGTLGQLTTDRAAYDALKASLENLRALTDRLDKSHGTLSRLMNDDATINALDGTLRNLEQVTGRMARGEGTAGKFFADRSLYDRLDNLTAKLDRVVSDLNAGKGTAGLFLRDEQLYQNINKTVIDVRQLIADVRKDPKKFLQMTFHLF
jgi:phospholipid/cholesterol/gamma-HCH transport system substrate-binding protein